MAANKTGRAVDLPEPMVLSSSNDVFQKHFNVIVIDLVIFNIIIEKL